MPDQTIPNPPDDTKHGPVPSFQPKPQKPESGRTPFPDPERPGDNPVTPPARAPFPDNSELPENKPPKSA